MFFIRAGEKRGDTEAEGEVREVMSTALTQAEFAAALGMSGRDLFVAKMFRIVDKDRDGRISFQEFLDTVVLFSVTGRAEDKLRIVFDMCDTNENGVIERGELQEMLASLVELAKTDKVRPEDVANLIDSMFAAAGFAEDKDTLTYEDFTAVMSASGGDFLTVGLDCKGAKHNFLDTTTNIARMQSFVVERGLLPGGAGPSPEEHKSYCRERWDTFTNFLEENRQGLRGP